MNEQLQARIQQYIIDGKSPVWIATELNLEDENLPYDAIQSYAAQYLESTKKKRQPTEEEIIEQERIDGLRPSIGEELTGLVTPVAGSEDLSSDSSSGEPEAVEALPTSVSEVGKEFLERYQEDMKRIGLETIEKDEVLAKELRDIAASDKSQKQKEFEKRTALAAATKKRERDLMSSYAVEIKDRLGNDVDRTIFSNDLHKNFGLAIPLDGDDVYNQTSFGQRPEQRAAAYFVDLFHDLYVDVGTGVIDLASGILSKGAASMAPGMSVEQRLDYARQVDQRVADLIEVAKKEQSTQYENGFIEEIKEVNTVTDAATVFSRSVRGVGQSLPIMGAIAVNPLAAAAVVTDNSIQDSEREDHNRIQNGLEPIFDESAYGTAGRVAMGVADGALTVVGGGIQNQIAKQTFKRMAQSEAKESIGRTIKDISLREGVMSITEGGVEALQEGTVMASQEAFGNVDYNRSDYLNRLSEAFVMGLATSGVISTPGAAVSTYQSLTAGSDVVTRPQAAANSVAERNVTTQKDARNVESLNNSSREQAAKRKVEEELMYRMIAVRHPEDMKAINDIDLFIKQAQIRYKRAEKSGASQAELDQITQSVFALTSQRLDIVDRHRGESAELTAEESRRYEDGRVAKRLDGINESIALIQEEIDILEVESKVPDRVAPGSIQAAKDRLSDVKTQRREVLRLLGEVDSKRTAGESDVEAMNLLRNELGLNALEPEVETTLDGESKPLPDGVREATAEEYVSAMSRAFEVAEERGDKKFLQVSRVDLESAKQILDEGGKLFITEDGSAGAYVKADGYMGGLFKSPDSELKGVSRPLQQARRENGGQYFDAYGTDLERQYVQNGFKPVARVPFNEEYAPEGWDDADSPLKDKPDLVFFTPGRGKIGEGETVADYDAGLDIAKKDLERLTEKPKTEAEPDALPEPEVEETASDIRGIEGEFTEFEAKEDGSVAITALRGFSRSDIRFVNKNLVKSLQAAFGNKFKIVAHSTVESGNAASKQREADADYDISALAVTNEAEGTAEIHLNLQVLNSIKDEGGDIRAVIAEELLHTTMGPTIRSQFETNRKVVDALVSNLEAAALKSGNQALIELVETKGKDYKDKRKADSKEVTEEQIVEYIVQLMDYDSADPTVIDRFRIAINKFLKATIGSDAMLITDLSNADAIIKKMQRSLRTGEVLTFADVDPKTSENERASISPSKLPESEVFEVQYMRGGVDKFGGPMPVVPESRKFKGKWHFINWWNQSTGKGEGIGRARYSQFQLKKADGSLEPINADVMKNWKLRPPLTQFEKKQQAAKRRNEKNHLASRLFKTIVQGSEATTMLQAYDTAFESLLNQSDEGQRRLYQNRLRGLNDYNQSLAKADIIRGLSLSDLETLYDNFADSDPDQVTERAAIKLVKRFTGSDADATAQFNERKTAKRDALCGIAKGSCITNDKVSMLQMESSLIKSQIGQEPSFEHSVSVAAEALRYANETIAAEMGVDISDPTGNYEEGVDIVMNNISEMKDVEVNPREYRLMYDLLVAYTSNGSRLDPNLELSREIFVNGLKRIQSGANSFISPRVISEVENKENSLVRGDRATTMASHLNDINRVFDEFFTDGVFKEQEWKDATRRDGNGESKLKSMIGVNAVKLAELYLGNTGDPDAIPMDGHFRDQFNIYRGRFNDADWSEGLVIPEPVRNGAVARIQALGGSVDAMSSDKQLFDELSKIKREGNDSERSSAQRIYAELVGNEIEKLRQMDKQTTGEAVAFVRAVAKEMGMTPFQVQQLMYHDGIYSMSSYQGKPFVTDYKSGMERSTLAPVSKVNTDNVQAVQMSFAFPEVDADTESLMPTPGRKVVTEMASSKDATTNQLYRDRDASLGNEVMIKGAKTIITDKMIDDALSTDATSRRIMAKGIQVEPGRKVGVRLNLNVKKNTGVPVQTMHEKTASGEAIQYAAGVTVKNAELFVNQNAREKIVTFQENKFPMASVNGEFVASGTDLNYSGVKAFFNPFRHNVFVDAAGRPIKSAGEATVVGSVAYLRGDIEYYDASDPVLDRGRIESEKGREKRIKRGEKYDKSIKRFEAYSKNVLGQEFASRQDLEYAFDNIVIPSEVSVDASEVASNMEAAMERASIYNVTKKFRQRAKKEAKAIRNPDIRTQIVKDPRNYIIPQKLKSLKMDIQDMSDAELIDIVNDEQLGRLSAMNDNLSVLAQAERVSRAVARGEADQIPDLVAEIASMGTTAGRLLRHLREVKKASPRGLFETIKAAAEANGNLLSQEREAQLQDITSRLFQQQSIVEDLHSRAVAGERVGSDLDGELKKLKKIERELDTLNNIIVEKGWGELLGQIAQGNLLTTMSQSTNVEANFSNVIFAVGADIGSAPVRAAIQAFNKIRGKELDVDRSYSLAAYFYAMSRMGSNMVATMDQVITGQDKDQVEWRQSRGLMPFRSMLAALKADDISKSQRAKLLVQGTLGVPAEIMFRALSFGDIPFRKYFEDKNLYEQAVNMGLEGEAMADFLKHPPRKNAEKARAEGRRITFQEETKFSKGVNRTIQAFEDGFASLINMTTSKVDGEQASKLLFRMIVPFRSTPANILVETATFASPVIAALRANSALKDGNIDQASQHIAKGMVGAIVSETALMMLAEGILSGPLEWNEDEEKNLAYDQFPPTSINISALKRLINGESTQLQEDDYFMNYMKLGTAGALMAAIAGSYDKEEIRERDYDGPVDFAKYMFSDMVGIGPLSAAGGMMDQSFMQGVNDFLQVLVGPNKDVSAESLISSVANVGMSIVLPNQVAALHRASREYMPDRRVTKDMSMGERVMKNIEYTVKDRTFGGAEIPIRHDWKGQPIKQNPRGNVGWFYQLFDVTKIRQGEADPVSQEIYRIFESTEQISKVVSTPSFAKKRKVMVPNIKGKKQVQALRFAGKTYSFLEDSEFVDGGVYFNTEQLNRVLAVAGQERYRDIQDLMRSNSYQLMSDEERLEALDEVNDGYNSIKEYDGVRFRNHTLVIFDIMQEIYDNERREED